MIIGRFSAQGYVIETHLGEEIYTAGNSSFDSQMYIDPESAGSCTDQEMKRFCRQTAREIAAERRESFGGIEYDEQMLIHCE